MKSKVRVRAMRDAVALAQDQERMRRRHDVTIETYPPADEPGPASERYYSVAEVAKLWNVSDDVVRRIFRKTPGVLKLGTKGRYVTLRIPARILERATAKLSACRKSRK
jgi:hypothetical protein